MAVRCNDIVVSKRALREVASLCTWAAIFLTVVQVWQTQPVPGSSSSQRERQFVHRTCQLDNVCLFLFFIFFFSLAF